MYDGILHAVRGTTLWERGWMTNALTEKQVAPLLNISIKTLQSWRLRGYGPRFRKFGRAVRYLEEDVQAFRESTSKKSTSE